MTNQDNYCVIMGGGIGSRFWPFSRKTLPKQFLDFFGTGRSLLQQTFDRFQKVIPTENIFIVTNAMYADLVKEQLPEVSENQILLEPARRNTAPCIAWASYHIRALNPNANIVVAPSDHLILKEDEFLAAIEKGLDFVSRSEKLLTLGIKPNRPETGYGYIQIDEPAGGNFYKVKTFTEKPELELAKVFVESGEFYWNSGLFMWNVNTIIKASEDLLPELASKLAPGKDIYATDKEKAFIEEISDYTEELIREIKAGTQTFRHDNLTNKKCPQCGKRLLAVNGKNSKMLVCQDRECGYRETLSRTSNARCPKCHKKMELYGKGEDQTFICKCGYKEKLSAFKNRREKEGAGVSKRDVQSYLKKQQKEAAEPLNNAFAAAFAKLDIK